MNHARQTTKAQKAANRAALKRDSEKIQADKARVARQRIANKMRIRERAIANAQAIIEAEQRRIRTLQREIENLQAHYDVAN